MIGVDVGTNMLVSAAVSGEDEDTVIKMQRDAFYQIRPKSPMNAKIIKASLQKSNANFIENSSDGTIVVVGEDALHSAIERGDKAQRPLSRGVISPKEKSSLPMLKLLLQGLVGEGDGNTKLCYSIPASPVDTDFNVTYHAGVLDSIFESMGFIPSSLNEAYAVSLDSLLDEGLTGMALSAGAGMSNVCVVHQGEVLTQFSTVRGGDYIDNSVGQALDISPSIVQVEKESGVNLYNPSTEIEHAVVIYYRSLLEYTIKNIAYELNKKKKDLPQFKDGVSFVVSGGLSKAEGFTDKITELINNTDFPIKINKVIRVEDPLTATARGCLLATQI